jgi:type I restriction-modification system DNA methylase subunit
MIDHRVQLENLVKQFSLQNLTSFLRSASGSFRPQVEDYSRLIEITGLVKDLYKVGTIDFTDGRRLMAFAGQVEQELTSQSGKQKQYEIAKKVLKECDAGIFAFHDAMGHFRFSLITKQYAGTKSQFSNYRRHTYFVSPDLPAYTFINQIGKADFTSIETITYAFSVEPVTKEFYKKYEEIFRKDAEASITLKWTAEQKRLYTQRFFNRLMFLAFLERKGWLNFNGRKDYLRALYADYHVNDTDKRSANFHRSRLNNLFFWGLNNPRGDERNNKDFQEIKCKIGDVPYLNGGLFEEESDDQDWFFPDSVVVNILNDLIYYFNFTVTESTPLDIEVAVDPEMLGKIFEELVTGRHESGSYYTPKPVVAFMCRESLKGYLETSLPNESPEALALFVDDNDPAELRNPEAALAALRRVRVCDPACGSGAYLLGMLHELLELRECLFAARQLDPKTVYERKLEIIQNNLYGVDKDVFAVNIARLRLWLSLIVDYEGNDPPPLPNLDFKIEAGDSLTAPDPSGGLQPDMFRYGQVQEFLHLKNEYMSVHAGQVEKKKLATQIKDLRAKIEEWAHPKELDKSLNAFDWQVDFAEVFAPELAIGTLGGSIAIIVNNIGGQMELTPAPQQGGFDIVLANPPYVRQELLGDYKRQLKPVYPEVFSGTADLYVYFYARAHQLLRPGGVACFISSNKWLRAGYGENLRQYLLDEQAFILVVDFGELPVFQTASTFPAIFLWQKKARGNTSTKWAVVKNLQDCLDEGIVEHVTRISQILPASQFGTGKSRLNTQETANQRIIMESKGQRLGELMGGAINFGIKTGFNDAFWIDQSTYTKLITQNTRNKEIIKPLLRGDDVRRYESHFRNIYILWTYIGVSIKDYPEIFEHLQGYEKQLRNRLDQGNYWWELRSCGYYDDFQKPKIVYPIIGKTSRFVMDMSANFTNDKTFFLPTDDWCLLGILNSQSAFEYLKSTCSILGDDMKGGRLEFRSIYMKTLPIPDVPQDERKTMARLAEKAQNLHIHRRRRVEQFLGEIGIDPARSTSRNPLEKPWELSKEDFTRRARSASLAVYSSAREETFALTEEIQKVETEIDERVKGLYGL